MNHCRNPLFRSLAALLTAAALVACGGSDEPVVPPPGPDPAPAGAVVRVEMSPAGGMLVDTAERRSITVRAFDANGTEVPLAPGDADLASSDATGIEVGRAGNGFEVRAAVLPRSALLTASVGTVSSKPAVFYSAQPAPGAITVTDAQVRSEPVAVDPAALGGLGFRYRLTLADVGNPAVGSIVVGTGVQPVGGRVVSSSPNAVSPTQTDIVLELVSPGELFNTLKLDLEFSPEQMNQLLVLAPGVRASGRPEREHAKSLSDSCKFDKPEFAGITGELEAVVNPQLNYDHVLEIYNGAVSKARFATHGTLGVSGKAVLNLGAAVTGGVTCTKTLGAIPIPITGPLAPLIAPVIPLNFKAELGVLLQVNAFTVSAEIKQTADLAFGFDYDVSRPTESQMLAIKKLDVADPELTRNISFPTAASLRVKATAFVGPTTGLDLGNREARLKLIEVFAGPEFEAKFGGSYDVATDSVYTSEYDLKVKAGIGPGEHITDAIKRLLGSAKALDMVAKVERSIAKTPGAASLTTEKSSFEAGEDVVFDVKLDPSSINFPLVGYNVKEVRIYRLRHGGTTSAELVATAVAFDGQTSFAPLWVADEAGTVQDDIAGKPNFYAFVVDKPLAPVSTFFPFELGAVSARDVGTQGLIAGGGTHSLAIDSAGRVVSWGTDLGGALGRDNLSNLPNFVDGLPAGVKVKAVAAGAWHSVAVLENGKVYAWGFGGTVARATGFTGQAEVPTAQEVFIDRGVIATAVATRYRHTLVLTSTGAVWGFGPNREGALGPYSAYLDGYVVGIAIDQVKAIAAGEVHSLALRNDGTVWAWGYDGEGQVAAGGSTPSPTQVAGLPPIKAIAASRDGSFALDEAGNVWSWGGARMLGRSGSAAPARIESLSGVKAISAGNHTAYALMSDGTVKAWGDNLYGRVGVASEDGKPATIPGLSDVVEVNGAEFHGMALTRSGAVYTWGRNELKVLNGTDTPFQSDAPILSGFFR
jgi:alpha-tubulin suppressor-like RCC1 family protein